MLKKIALFGLLIAVFSVETGAQQADTGWFSLKRLSLSTQGGYFFNAWDEYNNALATVVERIELDPFFVTPVGKYEKINGDAGWQALLAYDIFRKLSFAAGWGQLQTAAVFDFYPDPNAIFTRPGSPAHQQEIDFSANTLTLMLNYQHPLSKRFHLTGGIALERHDASFKMDWIHDRNARGPEKSEFSDMLDAELTDDAWGWRAQLGIEMPVLRFASLQLGLNYRNAKLDDFRGKGTYGYSFSPRTVDMQLVSAENYFGVFISDPEIRNGGYVLPPLTFLTEPDEEARQPTAIDLSAFGIFAGLKLGVK